MQEGAVLIAQSRTVGLMQRLPLPCKLQAVVQVLQHSSALRERLPLAVGKHLRAAAVALTQLMQSPEAVGAEESAAGQAALAGILLVGRCLCPESYHKSIFSRTEWVRERETAPRRGPGAWTVSMHTLGLWGPRQAAFAASCRWDVFLSLPCILIWLSTFFALQTDTCPCPQIRDGAQKSSWHANASVVAGICVNVSRPAGSEF